MSNNKCVLQILCLFALVAVSANLNFALADSSKNRGIELFKMRKYAQAVNAFESHLKASNADPTLYYYLGLSYYYKGQKSKMIEVFQKLVKEFPESGAASRANKFLGNSKSKSSSASKQEGSYPRFCRIRYKEIDKDIVVATKVNNRPIDMIFDTGAPDTWIGTNHLHSLGLPLPKGPFKKMRSQLGEDKLYRYWKMNVDLKIGPIERKNFEVLVQENRKGKPLIGQTFVKGYQFKIDHRGKELCFDRRAPSGSHYSTARKLSRNAVKFETKDIDYVWITAQVNGKSCKMIFDTGANRVIFPESYVQKYGIIIPPNSKINTYKAAGSTRNGIIRRLKLGPIERFNMKVEVANWVNMEEPLLGTSFYKNWEYTIDRKAKVIRFLRR